LELGIAYYAPAFPQSPDVNQYREVIANAPDQYVAALNEAESCFGAHGLTCRRLATADGTVSEEFEAFLLGQGFSPLRFYALKLTSWGPVSVDPRVRILPARAMRPALRSTFVDCPESGNQSLLADLTNERMDDSAYDMDVALVDNRPAGRCALYQVGDIARIMEFYALPGDLRDVVRESLLAHSLALAKRLNMRSICAQVPMEAKDDQQLFLHAGFEEDGVITEFLRHNDA
jgi:hypothetical protein